MKIDVNTLLQAITKGKENIETFALETEVGTKKMIKEFHLNAIFKRNEYVNKQIDIFSAVKESLLNCLNERYEKNIPVDNQKKYDDDNNKLSQLKKTIEYCNPYNSAPDKLGLTKIVCDIDDVESLNLNLVNKSLKKVFEIFKSAGVNLTLNDFSYSMFTNKYISEFISNMNSDELDNIMEETFDEIYWECPNIITHIKLNIMFLILKYNKELELLVNKQKQELLTNNGVSESNYLDSYNKLYKELKHELGTDPYINLNKFLKKELNINDFLEESQPRIKTFNKFLNGKFFAELNEKEQNDYYELINNLNDTIDELSDYYYFEFIIKDVIERYKQKDTYKGVYNTKLKEINKEEKLRDKLYKDYLKLSKKNKLDKMNVIKVQMNEQITKLDSLYKDLIEAKINDKIVTILNDGSTLYDVVTASNSFYSYLNHVFKKNFSKDDNLFDNYFKFCYNPGNYFIKKINMLTEYNIVDMVYEKYKLLGIELNKEELEIDNTKILDNETDMILLIKCLEESKLNIDIIKTMIEIKKIIESD